jgi:hypothetical protein
MGIPNPHVSERNPACLKIQIEHEGGFKKQTEEWIFTGQYCANLEK